MGKSTLLDRSLDGIKLERETRFELATSTLANTGSTLKLMPAVFLGITFIICPTFAQHTKGFNEEIKVFFLAFASLPSGLFFRLKFRSFHVERVANK